MINGVQVLDTDARSQELVGIPRLAEVLAKCGCRIKGCRELA